MKVFHSKQWVDMQDQAERVDFRKCLCLSDQLLVQVVTILQKVQRKTFLQVEDVQCLEQVDKGRKYSNRRTVSHPIEALPA